MFGYVIALIFAALCGGLAIATREMFRDMRRAYPWSVR